MCSRVRDQRNKIRHNFYLTNLYEICGNVKGVVDIHIESPELFGIWHLIPIKIEIESLYGNWRVS